MVKKIFISITLLLVLAVVGRFIYTAIQQNEELNYHAEIPKTIELASNDFLQNGDIPIDFTGYGKELSPELHWFNLPAGTKSLVMLCTDYDGPTPLLKLLTIDHWVVYNIPVTMNGLSTGITTEAFDMAGIQCGKNFKGTLGYKGPKPPLGKHRYFFRVYALSDSALQLTEPTKKEVMLAMKDKILAYGELIGIY